MLFCLSLDAGKLLMLQSFIQNSEYFEDLKNDFPGNVTWLSFSEILFVTINFIS